MINLHPGDHVGPYTLKEQIGKGAFGVIFKGIYQITLYNST